MAEITLDQIQPFPQANGYAVNGTVLRVWYSQSFLDSDGTFIEGGSGQNGFYIPVQCTVTNTEVVIPSFNLWSTIDAQDNNPASIRCFAQLYSNGTPKAHVFSGASTPTGWTIFNPDPANSWTFENLLILNQVGVLTNPPNNLYPTIQEMIDFQNSITYANASAVIKGITYLSDAPTISTVPRAYGTNSVLQPSLTTPTYYVSQFANFLTALTFIGTDESTLVIDKVTAVGTSSVSIPATMRIRWEGAGMLTLTTSRTLTVRSSTRDWPVRQLFSNALSGQGTVSFSGNLTATDFRSEWWGGGVGISATINTAAWNALAAAVASVAGNGAGTILASTGQYDFNGLVTFGTDANFSDVSIKGTGLYTLFNWTGATNGTMFRVNKGRNNRFDDFRLTSSVAIGTTIGMILTGPSGSLQTSGCTFTNVTARGFSKGLSIGEGSASAAELQFNNCNFSENATGVFQSGNGNTVVISYVNTSFGNNTTAGLNLGDGSGATHLFGCSFAANGTAGNNSTGDLLLSLGWNGTVHIGGARFEIGNGTTDAFRGGVINLGGMGSVSLLNAVITSDGVPTAVPFIMGTGNWLIDGMAAFGDGADGFILINVDGNQNGALTIRNSRIQNSNTRTVPGGGVNTTMLGIQFDPTNTGSIGLRIKAENNFAGGFAKFDDIDAVIGEAIGGTGKVIANRRINAVSAQVSQDWQTFGNQDATPSVKWGNTFKTNDTAPVSQTTMDDGVDGQLVTIYFADGNRTLVDGATQQLAGGVNFVATANDMITLRYVSSIPAWIEVSRSVN
jgi:hypothetical protein